MSSYTESLGLELPTTGSRSGTWGTMTNTNMQIIDRGVGGVGAITLSGTTHTLSTSDGNLSDGQYKVLVLGGSPSGTNTITISPNDQDKIYFVVNSSGQTVTFTQGSGANVSIPNGGADLIYADGAGSGAAVASVLSKTLTTGNIIIPDAGNIGSVSDTDAIVISSAGLVTVSQDLTVGDDLSLNSDSAVIKLGADQDVTVTHVADSGVTFKNTSTGDDTPFVLLIQTGETDIAASDILGKIQFQAPDEAAGTDAILVAAEVAAVSEGDFAADNNATKLSFKTAASEAAAEKMSLSSTGVLALNTDSTSIKFGVDADTILSHVADQGLAIKNANTTDDKPGTLYLQTGDTDIAVNDYLGRIFFQAPDESTGTDAVAVAAEVSAISEGDFAADNNATSLSFGTGSSGASTQKMKLSSTGVLTLNGASGSIIIPDGGTIGSASDSDALTINSTGDCTHEGHVLAAADSTYDIGATATRWRQGFFDEIEVGSNASLTASSSNAGFFNYAGAGSEYGIEVKTNASTGTALYFLHSTTTACGSISVGSSATSYNTSSDYRLKENVSDMGNAITRLKNLKPKRFNWISDENNELLDGFLAHEVDAVVPQAIHGEKDETKDGEPIYQGIDQSKLVPLLTGALQEAITKIEALESKVAALEAK